MDDPMDRRRSQPAPDAPGPPPPAPAAATAPEGAPNEVEEASLESFPASDPPAWIHTRGD